jgi:putative ABC transport system substrate-binding protein
MSARTVVRLVLCVLGLLTVPLTAKAQQSARMPRVGILSPGSSADASVEELRHGLRTLGYVEGQNIALEIRYAEWHSERLPALAAELVALKVDVLVTYGPPGVRAAKDATRTIPIVMARMDDAEDHGFVASLARPGGNVTGLSFQTADLSGSWLEFLMAALPSVRRVAVLWDVAGTVNQLGALEGAARTMDVQLHVLEVRSPSEFDGAFQTAKTTLVEGMVILASPLMSLHVARLAELAAQQRLPTIYYNRRFAEAGGLMAYGPKESDPSWGWSRAAVFVDKLLKGAKPADLPVERPLRFELVVNLRTAETLGLTLPATFLARVDEVIR